jgi:hypothetical protein
MSPGSQRSEWRPEEGVRKLWRRVPGRTIQRMAWKAMTDAEKSRLYSFQQPAIPATRRFRARGPA